MKFALTLVAGMLALAFLGSSSALAQNIQVKEGTIKSVDVPSKSFVFDRVPGPMRLTFTVDDKTVFTVDGKKSTFENAIQATRKAVVTYIRGDGESRVATKVQVTTAAKAPDKEPSGDRK